MAARNFRANLCGEGDAARVRYFIDGSECDIDFYKAQHVKDHGTLPHIPVGSGGAAEPDPVVAHVTEGLQQLVDEVDNITEAILAPDADKEEAQERAAGVAQENAHMGATEGQQDGDAEIPTGSETA